MEWKAWDLVNNWHPKRDLTCKYANESFEKKHNFVTIQITDKCYKCFFYDVCFYKM